MESINFLKGELRTMHSLLPYLEIKYEFNILLDTHIIQVKPTEAYERDDFYLLQQIELREVFKTRFPEEQIMFMTENILIQIENPVLELNMSKVQVVGAEVVDYEKEDALVSIEEVFDFMRVTLHNPKKEYFTCSTPIIVTPRTYDNFYPAQANNLKSESLIDKVKQQFKTKKTKISSDIKSELIFFY